MIIVGIDPGSRYTGFGVMASQGQHLEHGVVVIPEKLSFAQKLVFLAQQLRPLWQRWPEAITVVERVFMGKNADSAFKLGHVRGVCLMLAAENNSPVVEYAARAVKKVVTGHGGADKEHVQLVVRQILGLQGASRFDATDALALAICHAREIERKTVLDRLHSSLL